MSRFDGIAVLGCQVADEGGHVEMPLVLGYLRNEPVAIVALPVDEALKIAADLVRAVRAVGIAPSMNSGSRVSAVPSPTARGL